MMRHYHSRAHYIDLSFTSPLWPGLLMLVSVFVLVSVFLDHELPLAITLTQVISQTSESCSGYTPDTPLSEISLLSLNAPELSSQSLSGPPVKDRALWRTARRRSHPRPPRS